MNVLIVDDEPIIRQVLRTMIDWESEGLAWYGEAEDGLEAWDALQKGEIDIVVTDILMPRMDGLELVRKLEQEQLDVAVVVLSCLDDFQVVKEAMKHGAGDYILKPTMEPEGLTVVLHEAKEALVRKRTEAAERNRWREQLEQSRPTQTGLYLRRLLEEEPPLEKDEQLRSLCGTNSTDTAAFVSCMIHLSSDLNWSSASGAFPDAIALMSWTERQGMVLYLDSAAAQDITAHVRGQLQAHGGPRVSAGEVDRPHFFISSVSGIHNLVELQAALEQHQLEWERYFYAGSADTARDGRLPQEEKHNLLRALAAANSEAALHWLREIAHRIAAERPQVARVYAFYQELLSLAAAFAQQYNEALDLETYEEAYLHSDSVPNHLQLEPLAQFTESAILHLITLQSGMGSDVMTSRNPFIRKAYEYMQAHYHLPVSTTDIADHVRLSRSYLSDLYSKETGEPLSEALTRIRMQAAKRMLQDGSRKVYEIAEAVGFHDAKAFAKTFKKLVGCTPKEFVDRE
ncbi:response regulator [Paenibacillus cremeus]|uniref:Response regulator n=1 Tax=Paenibacillus cremeus TaxID=2163881 RepID=A0A559KDB7_9BACL|nr:response regulator [Paenibacillus cremeus]TVY10094.1 response regulator [Paenibacillus cremeus]